MIQNEWVCLSYKGTLCIFALERSLARNAACDLMTSWWPQLALALSCTLHGLLLSTPCVGIFSTLNPTDKVMDITLLLHLCFSCQSVGSLSAHE